MLCEVTPLFVLQATLLQSRGCNPSSDVKLNRSNATTARTKVRAVQVTSPDRSGVDLPQINSIIVSGG